METSVRRSARDRALLLAAVVGTLSLFVTKGFSIDDPLFVWLGQHLLRHPLDFYGFEVNWYGIPMPMHEVTMNPPLTGYYIAAVGAVLGFSEVALHVAFLVPAAAVCLGTYRLAAELCTRPLLAGLVGLLTPVFLVSGTSVMSDTMMLAFFTWSVFFWRRGMRDDSWKSLVLGASLAGLAALSKYYGLVLLPLLGAYGILVRRSAGKWLLPLLIPAGMALAYELTTRSLYGHGLILGAGEYAGNVRAGQTGTLRAVAFGGLVFAGGCFAPAILLGPFALGRRLLAACAGLLVLAALALPAPHALLGPRELVMSAGAFDLQAWLMAFGGLVVVALAVTDVWNERDPDAALLGLWVLGTLVFATFVNWVNNGRSNLPVAPAFGILVARRIDLLARAAPSAAQRYAGLAMVPAFLLALLVTYGDARWANASRRAAGDTTRLLSSEQGAVYFQGQWGFRYYAERYGALCLDPSTHVVKRGDVVIQQTNNPLLYELPTSHFQALEQRAYPASSWVHTTASGSGACFYASDLGPLPFALGAARPDLYTIWKVTRRFGWVVE